MTFETCIKQAENCRKHEDEEGALMYEARAERKKNRTRVFYENQAKACDERGDAEGAIKWRGISAKKLKEEVKVTEEPAAIDYNSKTVEELKALLDEAEIADESDALKADLISLLEA